MIASIIVGILEAAFEEARANASMTEAQMLARLRTVFTIAVSRIDAELARVKSAEAATDAAVAAAGPRR